ncbi:hypothetical protein [Wolbachia endosymbiont of Pentidionis agamae]
MVAIHKVICIDVLDIVVWQEIKSLLKEPDRVANGYQRRLLGDKDSLLC